MVLNCRVRGGGVKVYNRAPLPRARLVPCVAEAIGRQRARHKRGTAAAGERQTLRQVSEQTAPAPGVGGGGGGGQVSELSAADRQLLWKHRVTLTDKGPALLRLVKCANLDNERQVRDNGSSITASRVHVSYVSAPTSTASARCPAATSQGPGGRGPCLKQAPVSAPVSALSRPLSRPLSRGVAGAAPLSARRGTRLRRGSGVAPALAVGVTPGMWGH